MWSPHEFLSENVPPTTECAVLVTAAQWLSVQENETLAWHLPPSDDLRVLHSTREAYFSLRRLKGVEQVLAACPPVKEGLLFSPRDFVKAFIQFKKPIVVAINGPALGLGASILPLCDIVWASEKAWFQTPYATIRLTPAGCSSYTFPQILGVALVSPRVPRARSLFGISGSGSQQDPFSVLDLGYGPSYEYGTQGCTHSIKYAECLCLFCHPRGAGMSSGSSWSLQPLVPDASGR